MNAAIYCLASLGTDAERQDAAMVEFADRRGWTIAQRYRDTGRGAARTGFHRLMAAARRRRFAALVVYRADGAFRSLSEFVLTHDELRRLGIAFASVTETFDAATMRGIAMVERELIAQRARDGIAAARRRGVRLGRPRAEFDVRRARMLRDEGEPFARIAELLGVGVATIHRALVPKTRAQTGRVTSCDRVAPSDDSLPRHAP